MSTTPEHQHVAASGAEGSPGAPAPGLTGHDMTCIPVEDVPEPEQAPSTQLDESASGQPIIGATTVVHPAEAHALANGAVAGDEESRCSNRPGGWIKLDKADQFDINRRFGASACTVFAVWVALLTLANDRSSASFQVHANLIRAGAGISLRATMTALGKLEDLGFVKIVRHRVPGTKEHDASTYTILRSCTAYATSGNKRTTSGNNSATGYARDQALRLQSSSKKEAKASKKERFSARPSSAGAEAARNAQKIVTSPRPF